MQRIPTILLATALAISPIPCTPIFSGFVLKENANLSSGITTAAAA